MQGPSRFHSFIHEVALSAVAKQLPPLLHAGAPGTDKTIYLIRHGQSEYNIHYETHGTDPMVRDGRPSG